MLIAISLIKFVAAICGFWYVFAHVEDIVTLLFIVFCVAILASAQG